MTRDALVERLAEWSYIRLTRTPRTSYFSLPADMRAHFRDQASLAAPIISGFVAEFIEQECRKDVDAATCAERWREAMK